jgi:hypothetical protein
MELVCRIVKAHYEPGRHDRSLKAVWRRWVYPVYPVSYVTVRRYIKESNLELKGYDRYDYEGDA